MKKKLLLVNGHLNIGGVERSLVDLLKHIDFTRYEVDLVLFEEIGDYADELPKEVNIIFYDLTKTYGPFTRCIVNSIKSGDWFSVWLRLILLFSKKTNVKLLALAKPLFKLNKRYECAIAYRVGICTEFVAYIANSEKKVTWWHHGEYDLSPKLTKSLNKTYKEFDNIVTVSEGCKDFFRDRFKGLNNKLVSIPNIIDYETIRKKAVEPSSLGIEENDYIGLVSMGRLSPEKGMLNCVHACKQLIDNGFEVKWFLIGDGEQRSEIEALITNYRIENHISLLGNILNPYPYIKKACIYVHPSHVESLSIAVLEALALNTPVVVARSMGPAEYIRDKENGLLVEPTPEGLYKGILSLIEDKSLYDRLKEDKKPELGKYHPANVITKVYELIG